MYCGFGFFYYSQVVVIGAKFSCLLEVNPDVTVDFFLLNFYAVGKRLCKEEHYPLANFAERAILADFSKSLCKGNIKPCFLFDFSQSGFLLVFIIFYMTFRKTPISAVAVLHKQYLCILLVAVKITAPQDFS